MHILPKVQIMQNPRNFPVCSNQVFKANFLTYMYYISIYKNLYINIIKEKTKCDYLPTTLTTSLKAPLPLMKNVVPTCFLCGYYNLLQPTTFLSFVVSFELTCSYAYFYNLYCVVCEEKYLENMKITK